MVQLVDVSTVSVGLRIIMCTAARETTRSVIIAARYTPVASVQFVMNKMVTVRGCFWTIQLLHLLGELAA